MPFIFVECCQWADDGSLASEETLDGSSGAARLLLTAQARCCSVCKTARRGQSAASGVASAHRPAIRR